MILSAAAKEAFEVTVPLQIIYKQWLKLGVVGGITTVILALGRLRQEDRHEFEASLDLLMSFRSDWATQKNPKKKERDLLNSLWVSVSIVLHLISVRF